MDTLDVLTRAGIDFQLVDGSALGYYRHGENMPWDNDVDILVPFAQEPQIRFALQQAYEDPKRSM